MSCLKDKIAALLNSASIEREMNLPEERISRKDHFYEILTRLRFGNPENFKKISKILQEFASSDESDSDRLVLRAYVFALENKWDLAIRDIEAVIESEGWKNIDSWFDYAHFLRKTDRAGEALSILLDPERAMNHYSLSR